MNHDVLETVPEIAIDASRYLVVQILVVPQVRFETAPVVRGERASESRTLVQVHDVRDEEHLLQSSGGLPGTSRLQRGHGMVLQQHPLRRLWQIGWDQFRFG